MLYKKPAPHKTPILIYKPRFSCYKPYSLHWHSILYIAVSNIIYIQFSYRVCTVTNTTYMKRQLTEWIFILKLQMHSWLESFRSLNLVLTCKTTFTQVEYRKAQFNICKNLKTYMYLAFPTYIILVFGLKKAMFFVRLDKNSFYNSVLSSFPSVPPREHLFSAFRL